MYSYIYDQKSSHKTEKWIVVQLNSVSFAVFFTGYILGMNFRWSMYKQFLFIFKFIVLWKVCLKITHGRNESIFWIQKETVQYVIKNVAVNVMKQIFSLGLVQLPTFKIYHLYLGWF